MYYQNLSNFQKKMAQFSDKVDIIIGLELNNKITPEEAYQQIKSLYKELKKLRKKERTSNIQTDEFYLDL